MVFVYFIPEFHTIANYLKYTVYEYYSPYWMVFSGVFIYKLINLPHNLRKMPFALLNPYPVGVNRADFKTLVFDRLAVNPHSPFF